MVKTINLILKKKKDRNWIVVKNKVDRLCFLIKRLENRLAHD